MKLLKCFREKSRPIKEECTVGETVYSTIASNGVKPYTVLMITGFNFSDGNTEYILRDGNNNVYRLRDTSSLYLYKGQDLKKQRICDIVLTALALALLLAVTIVLTVLRGKFAWLLDF